MLSISKRTLARFLRHSVQALGVTIPSPRLRLAFCTLFVWFCVVLPDVVEDMVGVGVGWLYVGVPELPEVDWP